MVYPLLLPSPSLTPYQLQELLGQSQRGSSYQRTAFSGGGGMLPGNEPSPVHPCNLEDGGGMTHDCDCVEKHLELLQHPLSPPPSRSSSLDPPPAASQGLSPACRLWASLTCHYSVSGSQVVTAGRLYAAGLSAVIHSGHVAFQPSSHLPRFLLPHGQNK